MNFPTFYKTIVFGENIVGNQGHHSFFNEKSTHSTQHNAERHGLERLCIGGTLGYVVIKQEHEKWTVVDEVGLGVNYAVEADWGGVYHVVKCGKLIKFKSLSECN